MLTAIRVGNFKAFAEPQRIPVRPLTLIYGANSSGKSSILHSLIFARHATDTGELDVHLTQVGGTAVDLGGFRQFVHGRNSDLRVYLEWELSHKDFSKRLMELLPKVQKASIGLTVGLSGTDKSLIEIVGNRTPRQIMLSLIEDAKESGDHLEAERLQIALNTAEDQLTLEEISRLKSKLRVDSCWLDLDGTRFMSTTLRPEGHLRLDLLDREHTATKFLVENLVKAYSTTDHIDSEEINSLGETIDELIPSISFKVGNLFPWALVDRDTSGSGARGSSLVTVRKESRLEDLKKVIQVHLTPIIGEILVGISDSAIHEISKVTYLGPLRAYPPRYVGFSESNDPNWVAGGGATWDMVRTDSGIRQRVNEWLGNEKKLSTHYELRIRYLLTIEGIRSKFAELASRAIAKGYENAEDENGDHLISDLYEEIEESVHGLPDTLEKLESLLSDIQELVLFDKRSRTPVSHRDVGIGISQVLPVLVTCFASREKIVAMEQPEIHLHPALQAELGDVFIESALGDKKNTLLIETHSEHLLLRVMRRMRETSDGDLPEGVPQITPKDVCVLFVQPKGTSSAVRHLELDEEGQLLDAWPGGFFEEGYRERFA